MFFADTGALGASGVVTVQEYGSSPRHARVGGREPYSCGSTRGGKRVGKRDGGAS